VASLDELEEQLQVLDREEDRLGQRRAAVLRAYVRAAGMNEAVKRLGIDPRTLVRLQRLDELAMVIYRGDGAAYDDQGRPYGEVGDGDIEVQRRADSEWWRVAKTAQPKIKVLVVVVAGTVTRIWPVEARDQWDQEAGKVALPLGPTPLTPDEVARLYPELGLNYDDHRAMRRGLLREYLPLTPPHSDAVPAALADQEATP
jgi:hypothetical protein